MSERTRIRFLPSSESNGGPLESTCKLKRAATKSLERSNVYSNVGFRQLRNPRGNSFGDNGAQRLIETAQDSLISITEQTRDRDYEEARRNYSVIESSSRNDPIRVRARIRRRWEIAAKGELAPSLSAPATYSAGNRQLFSVFVMRYSGVNNAIVPRAICS